MVGSVASSYDSLQVGTGSGQFNPIKFHGNYFLLQTDSGTVSRGAIGGGSWSYGSQSGRFALVLNNAQTNTAQYIGVRCFISAGN